MSHEKKHNIGDLTNILTEQMKALNLVTADEYEVRVTSFNYGSDDAKNFEGCISRGLETQVLARANKKSNSPVTKIGYGAFQTKEYNHKIIKKTAENVKNAKRGVCHTFAQLAADHLMTQMLEGKIPPVSIKMVSHNNGTGSHTFLLLNHNSKDLSDLSKCLIVDPWAVVMGHWESYGVFNEIQYPFEMLDNLEVVYDSSKDKDYQKLLIENGIKERPKRHSYPKTSKETKSLFTIEPSSNTQPLSNAKPFFADASAQKRIKEHAENTNKALDNLFEMKEKELMEPYKAYCKNSVVSTAYANYRKENDDLYKNYCEREKKDIEKKCGDRKSEIWGRIISSIPHLIFGPLVGASYQEEYSTLNRRLEWLKETEKDKDDNLSKLVPENKVTWLTEQGKHQDENTWKKNKFDSTPEGKNIQTEVKELEKEISDSKSYNKHIVQISTLEGPARDKYIKENKCENLAKKIKSTSSIDDIKNLMKKNIVENKREVQVDEMRASPISCTA